MKTLIVRGYLAHKKIQRRFTLAGLTDGKTLKVGLAICSETDQFIKKEGRDRAAERAITKPIFTFQLHHTKGSEDCTESLFQLYAIKKGIIAKPSDFHNLAAPGETNDTTKETTTT